MYTGPTRSRSRRLFGSLETIAACPPRPGGFTVVRRRRSDRSGDGGQLPSGRPTRAFDYPELNPPGCTCAGGWRRKPARAVRRQAPQVPLRELIKRGGDVRMKTRCRMCTRRVDFKDGSSRRSTGGWAAGVAVSGDPELGNADRPGRRSSQRRHSGCGVRNIFVPPGDGSVIVDEPLATLAQPAIQTGKHAARESAGLPRDGTRLRYCDKGNRRHRPRRAVLEAPVGLKLTG